ncbi:MAG: hydroxymethylbilane synthase [Candidatus Krumholzibacteriia bacterium]
MSLAPDTNADREVFRLGTRGSDLALWQARTIAGLLQEMGIHTDVTIIKTTGDRIDDVPFSKLEGKGFFTKELEDAQLSGRVDFAVHSLKDLSTDMPDGLVLCAMVGREDPREMLLARPESIDQTRLDAGEPFPLKDGATVGTSAARRQAQVGRLRPDLKIADLRGNVPTRVNRLREGRYDAILLARAGLLRLELPLDDLFARPLDVADFVPAPAQGMLGIQCRDEEPFTSTLSMLHCLDDARGVTAERELLLRLEGGCHIPFGANVARTAEGWKLELFLAAEVDDPSPLRLTLTGGEPEDLMEEAWSRIQDHRRSRS